MREKLHFWNSVCNTAIWGKKGLVFCGYSRVENLVSKDNAGVLLRNSQWLVCKSQGTGQTIWRQLPAKLFCSRVHFAHMNRFMLQHSKNAKMLCTFRRIARHVHATSMACPFISESQWKYRWRCAVCTKIRRRPVHSRSNVSVYPFLSLLSCLNKMRTSIALCSAHTDIPCAFFASTACLAFFCCAMHNMLQLVQLCSSALASILRETYFAWASFCASSPSASAFLPLCAALRPPPAQKERERGQPAIWLL